MNTLSIKEPSSLQFNRITWSVSRLGEQVVLLEAPRSIDIRLIHESTHMVEGLLGDDLTDIVPAYHSIALFSQLEAGKLLSKLALEKNQVLSIGWQTKKIEIPVCYELGPDLEEVASHVGISSEEVIEIHLNGIYRSLFIGFTPGFIYADGLDSRLACPRKANPRTSVPAGSVGIGGEQTGIYSLQSPGGWNIIGRTPLKLFDPARKPPMLVETGSEFSFKRISKEAFESWEN